jgi:hypothetical protein
MFIKIFYSFYNKYGNLFIGSFFKVIGNLIVRLKFIGYLIASVVKLKKIVKFFSFSKTKIFYKSLQTPYFHSPTNAFQIRSENAKRYPKLKIEV